MQHLAQREVAITMDGGWRGCIVLRDAEACQDANRLAAWRNWLETLVSDAALLPGYTQLKYSEVNEVVRAKLPQTAAPPIGFDVICKRSSPRGLAALALGIAGQSRARRNFRRGRALSELGIGTAAPLAIIERATRGESWIITEYLPDLVDLDQLALVRLPNALPAERFRLKVQCISAVAGLFRAMEHHEIHHRDLKATNILLVDPQALGGREPKGILVDLDGLRLRSWRREANRRQRLMRLAASLAEYPTITRFDYARFLRQLSPGGAWRAEMRALASAAQRYNQAADRRRGRKWSQYQG